MKLIFLPIVIFISSNSILAQDFLPSSKGEIIKHTYYSLDYIEQYEQADWVYYILTKEMVTSYNEERSEDFRPDPSVSTGSAELSDYKNSGYDRGHLCAAGDMKFSNVAMSETFYLSNMSPQKSSFNRGIWKNLESCVRQWAISEDSIIVVTGGVLINNLNTIGANRVAIPVYYYKVIFDVTGNQKMIAFVLPNEKSSNPIQDYVVSVDSVQKLTGIDFFPQLPDSIENSLEKYSDPSKWNFYYSSKNYSKKENSGNATQCLGIAKSTGRRCKSMTTNTNGYCNYHQNQAPDNEPPKEK